MIDLHIHTTASDGSYSLQEIVSMSLVANLSAIAITDHDTVENAKKTTTIGSNDCGFFDRLELIPGIEISIYDQELDYIDVHILGLMIDPNNPKLRSGMEKIRKQREEQKREIIKKMNEFGYELTFDEVQKKALGSIGRPHIAKVLLERYPHIFDSISDIFERYLDRGKPAFVGRKEDMSIANAIGLIHDSGGLAFLAHPSIYDYDEEKLIDDFAVRGGDGLEVVYDYARNYSWKGFTESDNLEISKRLERKAESAGLLRSGGSDFHGPNKGAPLGSLEMPDEFLADINKRLSYKK